jgi:hypothetical protein
VRLETTPEKDIHPGKPSCTARTLAAKPRTVLPVSSITPQSGKDEGNLCTY